MAGFTNRGKFLMMSDFFNNVTEFTNLYVALVTSAVAPTQDTNTLGQLTEIAAGNGYSTGGIILTRNTTDFPTVTEDDANDRSSILIKNLVWTASGGNLPASGNGARYAILTTDEGTIANRQVIAYFDLVSDRTISSGQTLTLSASEMRFNEA